jgi:Domain of unknown function DUF29
MKYDTDISVWAAEQAGFLRQRAANALDWENLAEEIEAVGISQKREVYARLRLICQHLLKWAYQPEHRSRSWRATIRTQRRDLERVLRDSPSLRPYAATELAEAYARGREDAEEETGLLHLPAACPWPIEQVLDIAFLPEVPPPKPARPKE